MSNLVSFLTTVWLSSAAAQFNTIVSAGQGIVGIAAREVAAAKQPAEEIGVGVAFSQCQTVKQLLNVDHKAYKDKEPDLSKLTLNYYFEAKNGTYYLSEAADLILRSDWFDPSRKLYIYMHGFTDDPSKAGYQTINSALQSRGKVNILGLDASSLIRWLYLRSSTYVVFIGEKLGQVLASMVHAGLDPSSVHLIGHSLGAHISGYAGKTFTKLTGLKIGRLSGLDPAGPCFADLPADKTLNSEAANFVDVIHSDAGVFGLDRQVGDVDFWPNGGSLQPNCLLQTCGHSRAWEYFSESVVDPQAYLGVNCANWSAFRDGTCNFTDTSYMGFDCKPIARGNYFLQTKGESPYGRGEQGLKFVNNEGIVRNVLAVLE